MSERVAAVCIERKKIEELRPHPRNPRTHPKPGSALWEVMRRSLDSDYFDPVVWNCRNGYLVSGHLRVKVMMDMGFAEADVSVVDYDEPTHYARMIAANRPLGEFEEAILASLAGDIEQAGIDAALAGFDHKAMMALLDLPAVPADDEQAEELVTKAEMLQDDWKVQLGDVYQIGDHRLMCGDCGSVDNLRMLLGGGEADMIWTDPPYNIGYDKVQEHRNEMKGAKKKVDKILNDEMPEKEYIQLMRSWFKAGIDVTKPGGAIYICHADLYGLATRMAAAEAGWRLAQTLIWVKNGATLGRQDYQWQHEPILYGWKPGGAHFWQGGYCQSTVIDDEPSLKKKSKAELLVIINQLRNERETTVIREGRQGGELLHPTVKPVNLVARQIWSSSKRGETVLELFGGSGTTLVAAQQIGRKCVATELEPKFCAVILQRLKLLGLTPEKIYENRV